MKRLISIIAIMIVTDAFAANPETRDDATSQYYVETQLSNRQDTIPAKNGDKAVTPTGTKGQIGERDVKTTLGDEMDNQSDTGITTVATVKTAVDNKQKKIQKLPAGVNVVTYTGTVIDALTFDGSQFQSMPTTTPIYDENLNTYANGLVRAETLNAAVQRGVSNVFTQIDENGNESNNGGLWRINAFTNPLPTTIYAQANDGIISSCYKSVDPTSYPDNRNSCTTTLFDDMVRGDWGVVMPYDTGITYSNTCSGTNCGKEIRGISACSAQVYGLSYGEMAPASASAALQTEYETYRDSGTPGAGKTYCFCKLTNPHVAASQWVRVGLNPPCARVCTYACGHYIKNSALFRGAIFGAVTPENQE